MLLVLGDVSGRGYELSRNEWSSVLQQFHKVLGPFLGLPFHVVLGDRDIGECSGLNGNSVDWVARNFPVLDSAGCGAFEISNISFVSLNTVALLCGNSKLRFSIEKVIERESAYFQMDVENTREIMDESSKILLTSGNLGWRKNAMSSNSGPILLLHFPLHKSHGNYWESGKIEESGSSTERLKAPKRTGLVGNGPYELRHTLPPNATEYIFQALRPRIVFSAHGQRFSDHTHSDGTREVTVPGMTWDATYEPGFVATTFRRNGSVVIVSHCSLAKESQVVIAYISFLLLLILTMLVANTTSSSNS